MSSTNRGADRKPNDAYQTPPWAIETALRHVQVTGSVLEPCRGSGNITRALEATPEVTSVEWCELAEGRDFLTASLPAFDWIVTNPPYSLAQEFIARSLELAPDVLMLLRLNFLGSQERFAWWQDYTPAALFVHSRRPQFLDWAGKRVIGKNGKPGSDSCEYGWFYWGGKYHGIRVI